MVGAEGGAWSSSERLHAQWAEHRRLEAIVVALKHGQAGVHLPPYDPPAPPRPPGIVPASAGERPQHAP